MQTNKIISIDCNLQIAMGVFYKKLLYFLLFELNYQTIVFRTKTLLFKKIKLFVISLLSFSKFDFFEFQFFIQRSLCFHPIFQPFQNHFHNFILIIIFHFRKMHFNFSNLREFVFYFSNYFQFHLIIFNFKIIFQAKIIKLEGPD